MESRANTSKVQSSLRGRAPDIIRVEILDLVVPWNASAGGRKAKLACPQMNQITTLYFGRVCCDEFRWRRSVRVCCTDTARAFRLSMHPERHRMDDRLDLPGRSVELVCQADSRGTTERPNVSTEGGRQRLNKYASSVNLKIRDAKNPEG